MRGMKRLVALAILVTGLAAGIARAQTPPLSLAAHRVEEMAQRTGFSGEIVVADQTGPTVDQAWGLADRKTNLPHRAGADWLWASVTKQLTAILVMQEVEAGHLTLDGTIVSYLPSFRGDTGSQVTLRQLLQHSSGLPNPDDTPKDEAGVPQFYGQTGPTIGDTPRTLDYCSGPIASAPGRGFSYNNCDYLVLGAILERVTGRPYAELVRERLASPLGLKSLHLAPDDAPRGGTRIEGYLAGAVPFPPVNVATFGAAGALTGTARDLARINRALMAGKLLRPESLKILWGG